MMVGTLNTFAALARATTLFFSVWRSIDCTPNAICGCWSMKMTCEFCGVRTSSFGLVMCDLLRLVCASRTQRGKIGWTFDAQKRAQTFARAMHAAADGADRTIAGLRRFLVREARVTNCDQSLAHLSWQLQQRGPQSRIFRVCN